MGACGRGAAVPIRFRCAYCNQLMGIARRKAGTVVRCPKCAGQVVVPNPEPGGADDDGPDQPDPVPHGPTAQVNPGAPGGGLFEHSDFEKVFDKGPTASPQLLVPPPRPAPNPAPLPGPSPAIPEYDAIPMSPGSQARGIFLTSGVLAVICALGVVLMGMAFFLGLLLGRSSQP